MSDIFTKLYLGIKTFKYPNSMIIENDDINLLNKSLKKLTIQPLLLLTSSIIFSRSRPILFKRLKKFFYERRPQTQKNKLILEMNQKLSQVNESYSNSIKKEDIKVFNFRSTSMDNKKNEEIQEKYQNEILKEFERNNELTTATKINISSSRKLKTRRNFNLNENEINDDTITLTRKEPTFREDFFTFGKSSRMKVGRLLYFKKFLNKNINKESINNRALGFLLNTKLVYLPFVLFTFITIFDFGYTSFGLYLKYQPLIDAYFNYNMDLNLNNKI
jgi:hypothetical protein